MGLRYKMNKKGQIRSKEFSAIIVLIIIIAIILPLLTNFLNALTSGDIATSTDALVNAMIPLIIITMFFGFLRRFFR